MTATDKSKPANDATALANRVSVTTIVVNTALSALQLAAGVATHSAAMISSAVHTLSDLLTTFIVIIGVNLAGQKPDSKHQYGHERFECVASLILALILGIVGVWIGWSGVRSLIEGTYENKIVGGTYALAAAAITVAAKEWMYRYTIAAAKKINSGALKADAWHHRSDALATAGAFAGILGAMMGWPSLDAVASLVICLFIMKATYDIFVDAIDKMIDKSCDEKTVEKLKSVVTAQTGVMAVDEIRTRIFGSKMYVDIEIGADKDLTLAQAHKIAENVHDAVEGTFTDVKHCMVHVNPK